MLKISENAKKILENSIGLSLNQISELSPHEEIVHVKARAKKTLVFSKYPDPRKIGRGNPLLARKKITTIEEINAKIDALEN